jgi:hypothetical protein
MRPSRILLIILFIVIFVVPLVAFDMSGVYAYPVPFNPTQGVLTINDDTQGQDTIEIIVYDVNGDKIYSSTYSGSATWSGRNQRGNRVSPGLYYIKVTFKKNDGSDYGRKILRILVRY